MLPPTNRLTVTCTEPFLIDFSLTTMSEVLGFPTSGSIILVNNYTGPNTIQLQGLEYINVCSTDLVPFNHGMSLNPSINNVMDRITMTVPYSSTEEFQNNNGHHTIQLQLPITLQNFDLTMRDPKGNVIDFNGFNHHLGFSIRHDDDL